ncbi:hypothetical protein VQL36_20280 [Chengkuizengella sp. SCS-71B]|uniref:hypothetical protein n=1 Tax=Chengkuizengella sp. SCS-71B TaxID=3115290 RepID=UPI0032C22285
MNSSNVVLLITIFYLITIIFEIKFFKQLQKIERYIFIGIHVTIMIIFVTQYFNIEIPALTDFFIYIVSPWISSWME